MIRMSAAAARASNALKSGHLLDLTQTTLLIGVDKDPYLKELLRKENRMVLESAAKQFFGRQLTVELKKGGRPSALQELSVSSGVKDGEHEKAEDPLVKTALDILGGEVQPRRSHKTH